MTLRAGLQGASAVQEAAPPDEETILEELTDAAEQHPERTLLHYRALVSGRQYRRLYTLTRRYVPAGAQVLDWGAGNGHLLFPRTVRIPRHGLLARRGLLRRLDSLRWVPTGAGRSSEPSRLPFPDESFDAVVSVGVLEHVRETGGAEAASLAEIARTLRPGGVFLCYHFPNRTSWVDCAARLIPGMPTTNTGTRAGTSRR